MSDPFVLPPCMLLYEPNLAGKVDALSLFKYKAPLLLLINQTRDSLYNNTIGITIRSAV